MPKVPVLTQKTPWPTQGPNDLVDIQSFGKVEQAQARTWEALGAAGLMLTQEMGKYLHHREMAQDYHDYSQRMQRLNEGLFQLRHEVQQNPDPETWGPSFKEGAQKLFDGELAGARSEAVQAHLRARWASHYPAMQFDVIKKGEERQRAIFAGQLPENEVRYAEMYGRAESDMERARIKAEFHGQLAGGVQAGIIAPEKAAAARQSFEATALAAVVKTEAMAPGGAVRVAEKLTDYQKHYPGMSAATAMGLRGPVQAEMHRQQQEAAKEVDKLYQAKELTPDKLAELRETNLINLGTFHTYDAALKNDAAPMGKEMNFDTWARLHDQAMKGRMQPEAAYNALKAGEFGGGMGAKATVDQLIRLNAAQGKGGGGPGEEAFRQSIYFKAAWQEIGNTLEPMEEFQGMKKLRTGAAQTPSPTAEAQFMFLDACKQAQEQGQAPGPWMRDKAREIMTPFIQMGPGFKGGQGVAPAPPGTPPPAGGKEGGGRDARPTLFAPTKGPKGSQQEPW